MSATWYVDDLETLVRMEFDNEYDAYSYQIENKDKFLISGRYKEIWRLADLSGKVLTEGKRTLTFIDSRYNVGKLNIISKFVR